VRTQRSTVALFILIKSFYLIQGHVKQHRRGTKFCFTPKREIKVIHITNFPKIVKFRCREICAPQNREIKISRKFYLLREFLVFPLPPHPRSFFAVFRQVTLLIVDRNARTLSLVHIATSTKVDVLTFPYRQSALGLVVNAPVSYFKTIIDVSDVIHRLFDCFGRTQ